MALPELYFNKIQLKAALEKCLQCANAPCMKACPVGCHPKEFIAAARVGKVDAAAQMIQNRNPLGHICGLICPHRFCMKACLRARIDAAVPIPKIQATLMMFSQKNKEMIPLSFTQTELTTSHSAKSVAVVGAGPAGLAATWRLLALGYTVHLFEASNKLGGALNLIPEERLPQAVIAQDTALFIHHPKCTIHFKTKIKNIQSLLNEFAGVIWAVGEQKAIPLTVSGGEMALSFTDYLREPQKYAFSERVAIIGGGNVAFDCALTAKRNGAKHVELFVRRRLCDMRIERADYQTLIENEINISPLTSPTALLKQADNTYTLRVCKNSYENGILQPIPQTEIDLTGFHLVIVAIGSRAETSESYERLVRAGDCQTGGSTAVEAIASGINAADFLQKNILFR